jgi:predicted metal-binding membrane protein
MNLKSTLAKFASNYKFADISNAGATPPIAFIALSALAFLGSVAATIYFCHSMSGGMDMPGGWTMSMMWMHMPGYTWSGCLAMFLVSWFVMMVAMMLPSALPMLLNIHRSPVAVNNGKFETLALAAALGYFFVWTAIGVVIYLLGVAFALEAMQWDWLSRLTPALSAVVLVAAGLIQFTRWKIASLNRCRAPDCGTLFDSATLGHGWRYGFRQGMVCCICCTAPMLALLVLGAMNLGVMILIAVVISAEKLLPRPERTARFFGIVALLAGAYLLVKALLPH